MQRAANALCASSLVPEPYRGKANIPNCMIALRIADAIGADPLMVMQNLDIVHGRPSWRAQFLIGTVNTCGRFSAIRYEFFGERNTDSWGCRAWAVEKSTEEKLVGPDITIAIAKQEGWYNKNGSKWKTIPQLMLMYRAGAWWARAYAPELSLGFHTAEEIGDMIEVTARTVDDSMLKKAQEQLGAPYPTATQTSAATITEVEAEVIATEEAGEQVLAEEAANEAESPLQRGTRLLATCKTDLDVAGLHTTIAEELTDDDEALKAWGNLCNARAAELAKPKKK